MRKLNLVLLTTAAAICGASMVHAQSPQPSQFPVPLIPNPNAATILYAGGATLPSLVYRRIFDCYGFQVQPGAIPIDAACSPPQAPALPATGNLSDRNNVLPPPGSSVIGTTTTGAAGAASSGAPTLIMYAGLGSGAGKNSLTSHIWQGTPAATPPFNTTNPVTVNWSTVAPVGYPGGPDFVGSDDLLTSGDVHAYAGAAAVEPYKGPFGNLFSFPALIAPVAIPYNPSGLTVPAGGLQLSRRTMCGIFSGHITNWNDASITGDNGAAVSGGQQITIVHRTDGSGTTFLFTNAMVEQCKDVVGKDSSGAAASYAFPWTDRLANFAAAESFRDPTNTTVEYTLTGQCNPQGGTIPFASSALPIHGANLINWPSIPASGSIPANADQCGVPVTSPAGSVFTQPAGTGSSALVTLVNSTTGAIGYVSPDFTSLVPGNVSPFNLPVAKLQNQYHLDNPSATLANNFIAPTAANAAKAMAAASADFTYAQNAIFNPLNWAAQGVVANPLGPNSYPITGFTWLDLYQCYSTSATNNKFAAMLSLLAFYYGNSVVNGNYGAFTGILQGQGFSPIPANWLTAVIDAILGVDPFNNASTAFGLNGSSCTAFE